MTTTVKSAAMTLKQFIALTITVRNSEKSMTVHDFETLARHYHAKTTSDLPGTYSQVARLKKTINPRIDIPNVGTFALYKGELYRWFVSRDN